MRIVAMVPNEDSSPKAYNFLEDVYSWTMSTPLLMGAMSTPLLMGHEHMGHEQTLTHGPYAHHYSWSMSAILLMGHVYTLTHGA